jgi:hypothetical protein
MKVLTSAQFFNSLIGHPFRIEKLGYICTRSIRPELNPRPVFTARVHSWGRVNMCPMGELGPWGLNTLYLGREYL